VLKTSQEVRAVVAALGRGGLSAPVELMAVPPLGRGSLSIDADAEPSAAALFRTAACGHVLHGFGTVFREQYQYTTAKVTGATVAPHDLEQLLLGDETRHAASDAVYFATAPSTRPDAFLSHTWADSALLKYLALCYRTNLGRAVLASWATWAAIVLTLVGTHAWDVTALGGIAWLKFAFLGAPSTVFFATFFFGHAVMSALAPLGLGREEQWWLDKLCIHQTREAWKLAGVQMLPTFVQSSDRLVLLWRVRATFPGCGARARWLPSSLHTALMPSTCSLCGWHLGCCLPSSWTSAAASSSSFSCLATASCLP